MFVVSNSLRLRRFRAVAGLHSWGYRSAARGWFPRVRADATGFLNVPGPRLLGHGTYSILRGNVLALASITLTTGVTVDGRTLAITAAVTLDTDTITRPTGVQQPVGTTTALASSANPTPAEEPVSLTAAAEPG